MRLAREAVAAGDTALCAAAMRLLIAILGWDFHRPGVPARFMTMALRRTGADQHPVMVPADWAPVVLGPEASDWLAALIEQQCQQQQHNLAAGGGNNTSAGGVQQLADLCGQLLLALCSLSGDIVSHRNVGGASDEGRAAAANGLHSGYVRQMLRMVLTLMHPVESVVAAAAHGNDTAEQRLLSACRSLSALVTVGAHRPAELEAASQALGAGSLFQWLQAATLACIQAGGAAVASDSGSWATDATACLMEAWGGLLHSRHSMAPGGAQLPPTAIPAASTVFKALMQAALRDAASGAHEDADDDEEEAAADSLDDWMAQVAALARVSVVDTFGWLADAINGQQQRLYSAAMQRTDPSEDLEALCWLLRCGAAALADSGAGETPLVPEAVAEAAAGSPAGAEAASRLSNSLLQVSALVLQDEARPVMSPRLMEVAAAALARWLDTYLLGDDEDMPPALAAQYGPGSADAARALDVVVQVASRCLLAFPGEVTLHRQVCTVLLPTLVKRRLRCSVLVGLASWQQLAAAFASQQAALVAGLHPKVLRHLSCNLALGATGFSLKGGSGADATAAAAAAAEQHGGYVRQLTSAAAQRLLDVAARPDLATPAVSSHPQLVREINCLLEMLRGVTAAGATATKAQPALFALTVPLLPALQAVARAFKDQFTVVIASLKLAKAIIETHVPFVTADQFGALVQWVLQLLRQYAQDNKWLIYLSLSSSPSSTSSAAAAPAAAPSQPPPPSSGQRRQGGAGDALAEEALLERCRALRALIGLLQQVMCRDLIDLSPTASSLSPSASLASATSVDNIGQVVLLGLDIIVPLMSTQMLKYPKLCRQYFTLVADTLEMCPRQVTGLPPAHFSSLMTSLEFGVLHTDGVVVQSALEGLAALARHSQHAAQTGAPGLGSRATGDGRSVVAYFMEVLFRKLLLEDMPQELVELAADALLPLIETEEGSYRQLAGALLASQAAHDARTHDAVSQSLAKLLPATLLQAAAGDEAAAAAAAAAASGSQLQRYQLLSNRANKRKFRECLCTVVAEVRGLIRTK